MTAVPIAPTPITKVRGAHEPISHDSAVGHVTGRAIYLDDMPAQPDLL